MMAAPGAEHLKCPNCGWINPPGEVDCSWCHAPLTAAPASADALTADTAQLDIHQPAASQPPQPLPPPGYYLASDGRYYPGEPVYAPPRRGKSPCFIVGMIVLGVIALPFLIIAGVLAACFISMAQPSPQLMGNSGAGQIILLATGAVAVILLLIFSFRRARR
jgi:hypothetical protein